MEIESTSEQQQQPSKEINLFSYESFVLRSVFLLSMSSVGLFLVGAIGRVDNTGILHKTAWYEYNDHNVDAVTGLSTSNHVQLGLIGKYSNDGTDNAFTRYNMSTQHCYDAGLDAFVLTIIAASFSFIGGIVTHMRVVKNDSLMYYLNILVGLIACGAGVTAFATFSNICVRSYVNEMSEGIQYYDFKLMAGSICVVIGFVLMFVASLMNLLVPAMYTMEASPLYWVIDWFWKLFATRQSTVLTTIFSFYLASTALFVVALTGRTDNASGALHQTAWYEYNGVRVYNGVDTAQFSFFGLIGMYTNIGGVTSFTKYTSDSFYNQNCANAGLDAFILTIIAVSFAFLGACVTYLRWNKDSQMVYLCNIVFGLLSSGAAATGFGMFTNMCVKSYVNHFAVEMSYYNASLTGGGICVVIGFVLMFAGAFLNILVPAAVTSQDNSEKVEAVPTSEVEATDV